MNDQLHELHIEYQDISYRLSVKERPGSDNLIVFLHGWGGSKESFTGAFLSDALKDFAICTIDLVGFGDSEKPMDFSYDLQDQAHIIVAAIKSFPARKIYLVGHSMGGGVGLLATQLLKEKVVLFISAEGNLAVTSSSLNARIVARQPFWLFRSFTLPLIKLLLRLHPRDAIRIWAQWFNEASPWALYKSVQSLVEWSNSGKLLPLFKSLPHKAYIYSEHGTRRKDVIPALNKQITYKIPSCGHELMSENPDDFYTTVAAIITASL